MKVVTLTDLLTREQIQETGRIIAIHEDEDEVELVKRLTAYYETFQKELEEKGVIPGYLALIVVATVGDIMELVDEMVDRLKERDPARN